MTLFPKPWILIQDISCSRYKTTSSASDASVFVNTLCSGVLGPKGQCLCPYPSAGEQKPVRQPRYHRPWKGMAGLSFCTN